MKKNIQFFLGLVLVLFLIFNGCRESINENEVPEETIQNEPAAPSEEFLAKYKGCSWKTRLELLRVMISTAKYLNFQKAIDDGYADINVVMPNMGYHYLKADYLDRKFEITRPEILVYSKNPHNGKMKLVAVEYAVPIDLSPDSPPEGFTGDADIWNYNTDFGLWLLHAWVWKYNPEGIFNPTNPRVP